MTDVGYCRDASWWNTPNTSSPMRVHRDCGNGFAACSSRIMLVLAAPVYLATLPHDDALCRRCFPDAGLGLPLGEVIRGGEPPACK